MNGIFVAATRQHVGKTTVSLSLLSGLKNKIKNVGFLKPVGQQHVLIDNIRIDKDVKLFKEFFKLDHCDYKYMSPVIVGSNYTKDYIMNDWNEEKLVDKILNGYNNLKKSSDFIVVEGTGHTAVGSVVGLSNAAVASILGLDMLLVVNGGIGNTIDEIELNKAICDKEGVKIKGIVVNKVFPHKLNDVQVCLQKYLNKYDIPLIGVVPNEEGLDNSTILDLESILKTNVISEKSKKPFHFKKIKLIDTTLKHFLHELKTTDSENTLFIAHASRNDIALGFCSFSDIFHHQNGRSWQSGLILCENEMRENSITDNLENCRSPIISTEISTTDVLVKLKNYIAKLNAEDPIRTESAIKHYSKYISIDKLV